MPRALMLVLVLGAAARAGTVDLEWRLRRPEIRLGGTFEVDIFAVSSDGTDQPVFAVTVVLEWDPSTLELVGHIDATPPWQISDFFNDEGIDGLNADCAPNLFCVPYTGLPFNDGQARFDAGVSPGGEAPDATAEGLLVTTLRFRALSSSGSTLVRVVDAAGPKLDTRTSVSTIDDNGTRDITGVLGALSIPIVGCGILGDYTGDCLVDQLDFPVFDSCMLGPDVSTEFKKGCLPGDFDGDGDTDLRDAAALQRWVTGP